MGTCVCRRAGGAFLAAALVVGAAGRAAAALPPNFADQLVANVAAPVGLAFTPDGRLLITTQQAGELRVYQGGALLATPALTIPAAQFCNDSERGFLGVAVDPQFATNNFVYLFYTFAAPGCVNRVSRFVLPPGNIIDPGSELVLVDNMPATAGNHNGGDLHFGRDGYLYISIGDGGCDYDPPFLCGGGNDAARDEHVLTGKILRITRDGGIPPGNPFQGAGTARCNVTGRTTPGNRCQETYAWGLRNPFRLAFNPNVAGTEFRINDVGQTLWEEIDLGQAGADYGWNCREGAHDNNTSGPCSPTPPAMVDPLFEYPHGDVPGTTATACAAITAGAYVPQGLWPGYDGTYLFADFVCGWLFHLSAAAPYAASDFATGGTTSAVTMIFGPYNNTQALYYTTYAAGGQVRRIFYGVAGNNPPTAVAAASPRGGPLPLTVTFDATDSSDPDAGDTLTYFWNFGDGSPEASTTSLTLQHTYTTAGVYTATLRARDDDFSFSTPVTLTVQPGNRLPVPTITVPGPADTFRVGQVVNLAGSATDMEDGALASSRLSWTVLRHHATHSHPWIGPVSGSPVPMNCPPPEDLSATDNSYLEVRLTATDLSGLSQTVVRNFQPLIVPITLQTVPTGLTIPMNGSNLTGPATFNSWADWTLNVNAPDQLLGGNLYTFFSWSDGGARSHPITTPPTASTYTATFQLVAPPPVLKFFPLTPCRLVDTRGAVGPTGGPALASGAARVFDLDGLCGIPANARAVAVNLTVTQATADGFLTAFPEGTAQPLASALNFRPARARANNATVTLGATGALSVYCGMATSGTTHFIMDVTGYYRE